MRPVVIDGGVKRLDIETRRDIRLGLQNDFLEFLENGFGFKNRDILFTGHDPGVHFRLRVRSSVFDRRCESADTMTGDIEAEVFVRLVFGEGDQERRSDLVGLPAGLDRHIDATRSIAVRLRLRDTL